MQVTETQLREIASRKRITSWTADNCPVCDYPIKFTFSPEKVMHDPGCHCSAETFRGDSYIPYSWSLVADWINSKTDLELIKQIKQFWEL